LFFNPGSYNVNSWFSKFAFCKWVNLYHYTMDALAKCPGGKADYSWGNFSKSIPGRVRYQCSDYYRILVKTGAVVDGNYVADANG
jgi:hypothetical protein